jgi:hypothetical protein
MAAPGSTTAIATPAIEPNLFMKTSPARGFISATDFILIAALTKDDAGEGSMKLTVRHA